MRKFKMPTAYTTLVILIFISVIFTHIIPAGKYQYEVKDGREVPIAGTYEKIEPNPQGFWEFMLSPMHGFSDALSIILFVLMIGGFLGVAMKTGAINSGISTLVNKYKGREKLMIPILMFFFSIGGTTFGLAEETVAFYPVIVPLFLLAGYDVVVAMMVIILGSASGILGATINPFSVAIASRFADIPIADGMGLRIIFWISALTISIIFVMRYAEKIKKNPEKSIVYDLRNSINEQFLQTDSTQISKITKSQSKVLIIFSLTFLIMIVSLLPWQSFNITIFTSLNDFILSVPILGSFLGNVLPLGQWYFTEISSLFVLSAVVIGKVYGMKEKEIASNFVDGARDLLGVALILALSRAIMVIMTAGNITDTILYAGEMTLQNVPKPIYTIANYFLMFPLAILIPSSSGVAATAIPILAPLADFVGVERSLIVTAYMTGIETMNLMSPTYVVLMSGLAISQIPYDRWLKHIIPYIVSLMILFSVGFALVNIF